MAKIIPINVFDKASSAPLTPSMIKTLTTACEMQNKHENFGQIDVDGSFTVLVKRGYIDRKKFTLKGVEETVWFVTKAGIKALKKAGIDDPSKIGNKSKK